MLGSIPNYSIPVHTALAFASETVQTCKIERTTLVVATKFTQGRCLHSHRRSSSRDAIAWAELSKISWASHVILLIL